MKNKWKILAAMSCLAFLAVILGSLHTYNKIKRSISDGYALWATSEIMIAHHWKTSTWPTTWDDLLGYEEYSRHLAGHSIEDLRRAVVVDFASISGLIQNDLTQMNEYVSLRSGQSGVWERPQEIFEAYMADPEEYARRKLMRREADPGAGLNSESLRSSP